MKIKTKSWNNTMATIGYDRINGTHSPESLRGLQKLFLFNKVYKLFHFSIFPLSMFYIRRYLTLATFHQSTIYIHALEPSMLYGLDLALYIMTYFSVLSCTYSDFTYN